MLLPICQVFFLHYKFYDQEYVFVGLSLQKLTGKLWNYNTVGTFYNILSVLPHVAKKKGTNIIDSLFQNKT